MAQSGPSPITISAFSWLPDFARGNGRDLVVRWALAELALPYRTHLIGAADPRHESYVAWHPFGQVPAMRDGDIALFESGAILLHLAQRENALLPADHAARAHAISWLFAALATAEPLMRRFALMPLFHGEEPWCNDAAEAFRPLAERRVEQCAAALENKQWIAGEFSIADIMLAFVLRTVGGEAVAKYPALVAYLERAMARPAYGEAMAAHEADLGVTG